jgi:hypothetical protein
MRNVTAVPPSLPVMAGPLLFAPTALADLGCQRLGRRQLLGSRLDVCREVPHVRAVGPALLVGWIATLVAFVLAVV